MYWYTTLCLWNGNGMNDTGANQMLGELHNGSIYLIRHL